MSLYGNLKKLTKVDECNLKCIFDVSLCNLLN